ncbi:MAG: LD-carboxypeptidase [Muribaculaceae bacterium]|nr:LD-carboxypeptidase [Muribaculaceae bacterium]
MTDSTLPILTPRPLQEGDRVAILSPASIIKPQVVYEALPYISDQGWDVYTGNFTFDRYGTYAGTDNARYSDLERALTDTSTRAIICSRGGYGAVHLLERLNRLPLRDDPKWIVGYSDITALHALMSAHGIQSIHAPMCKHIATFEGADEDSLRLFDLLRGNNDTVKFEHHTYNRPGTATGRLLGGNLAVAAGLISTPFSPFKPGSILFVEDIAEPIYKVERIFYTLRLSGLLGQLGGLIVGRFTDYTPDRDNESMEAMIERITADYDYPVVFGTPIGHVDHNIPMLCSSTATLTVDSDGATLTPL